MKGLLVYYLLLLNAASLIITIYDKWSAPRKGWRVPEKWFFLLAALGGSPGLYISLLAMHHKTRHWYFMYGIPVIMAVQAIAIYFFLQ